MSPEPRRCYGARSFGEADGNVFVSHTSGGQGVFKITPGGTITEIIDSTGDGINTLDSPRAVAVAGSGNVFVADSNEVFKITPGGVITRIIDSTGDGSGNTFAGVPLGAGVAVDEAENVYVAGGVTDNAFKITPGGVITAIIDSTGDGLGNILNNPTGLDVDAAGTVFITALFSNNAFRIAPDSTITKIIDATGDGMGNAFDGSNSTVGVSGSGIAYVGGNNSIVFRIQESLILKDGFESIP